MAQHSLYTYGSYAQTYHVSRVALLVPVRHDCVGQPARVKAKFPVYVNILSWCARAKLGLRVHIPSFAVALQGAHGVVRLTR